MFTVVIRSTSKRDHVNFTQTRVGLNLNLYKWNLKCKKGKVKGMKAHKKSIPEIIKKEFREIQFPSENKVKKETTVVIVASIAASVILLALDSIMTWIAMLIA